MFENLSKRGYHLLEAVKIILGHNDLGELETERLRKWVTIIRESCEEVREALVDFQPENIMRGMCTGVYNSRGVTTRMTGDGGVRLRLGR